MANGRAGSFLFGLILGGAVGGALAYLLAPQAGNETRSDLQATGVELKARAATLADQAKELGQSAVKEQRTRVEQAVSEGKKAAQRTRKEMLDRYEKAKTPE